MAKKSDKHKLLKLDVKITFPKYTNGDFGIYEVEIQNAHEVVDNVTEFTPRKMITTVLGNFDRRFHIGDEYIMFGTKEYSEKYRSDQFKVQLVQEKFSSTEAMKPFLLQFVAESIADQLFAKYGNDVMKHIIEETVDLSIIKGMGEVRFKALKDKIIENEHMVQIVAELGQFGITPLQMRKIVEKFGANSVQRVTENPYELCKISGIGFLKADDIAKRMGYDLDSPNRIQEAIKYVILQSQNNGNSWMATRTLIAEAKELLDLTAQEIAQQITQTVGVIVLDNKVCLQSTYDAEKYVAERLLEINKNSMPLPFDPKEMIREFEEKFKDELPYGLTDEQKQLFYNIQQESVNYLVGYAGCGKSFLQRLVLYLMDKLGKTSMLLAPTGKASKVLEQYTGRSASTIHRATGMKGDGFDEVISILHDIVLVDESSMADIFVISKLVEALANPNVRVIFIGDDFQIPSVGVGLFLHDSIHSGVFKVTKLTQVFRQAEGGILDVATKIRMKEKFIENDFKGRKVYGKDLVLHSLDSKDMTRGYQHYYSKALEKYKPEDIMILTPTKKGELGTETINRVIQNIANPASSDKAEIKHGFDTIFRVGDRVINIKNNYKAINQDDVEKTVYNGDMGVIIGINEAKREVIIDYDFDIIRCPFGQLDQLIHSYALTIHKSQGSGFPVVIVVVDKAHKWQLNANLLYTAPTRAKKFCAILCQPDVINLAMKKNVNIQRNTLLKEFLVA